MTDPDLSPEAVEALALDLRYDAGGGMACRAVAPWILRALSAALAAANARATTWKTHADVAHQRAEQMEGRADAAEARAARMEGENAGLREALQGVVDDYPVAAGTSRSADPDMQGYGSILRARLALTPPDTVAPPAPRDRPVNPEDDGA